jgi:UDP-glucose 4-epimerase
MTARPIAVVTGGAAFIGSHMVDLLVEQGYEVWVIDSLIGGREANLAGHLANNNVVLDIRDIRELGEADTLFSGAKYVFHFAGIGDIVPSMEHPLAYMSANVQGTVHVLEAARAAKVARVVYAASSSCYGLAQTPTPESHKVDPQYPYALSKYLGEVSAFHWRQAYQPVDEVCPERRSHRLILWGPGLKGICRWRWDSRRIVRGT